MRKILLFLLTMLSFAAYAQEADSKSDPAFDAKALDSAAVSQLIVHRGGMFDAFTYKLLDGTKLSYGELNSLLKAVPENKSLLTKKNIWMGLYYACLAGFAASAGVNVYATHKDWKDMQRNSALACAGCFAYGIGFALIGQSYKSHAIDNYNLRVMGIPVN
jgi:hypothetical protein